MNTNKQHFISQWSLDPLFMAMLSLHRSVKDLARLSLTDPVFVSVHENASESTPDQLEQVGAWLCLVYCTLNALNYYINSAGFDQLILICQCLHLCLCVVLCSCGFLCLALQDLSCLRSPFV